MQDNLYQNSNRFLSIVSMLLALTILFPEVGLVSFSDVQPNFFLLSAVCTLVLVNSLKINKKIFLYFMICMLFICLSFIIHQKNMTWLYILKYSISFISVFLCYVLLSNRVLVISQKLIIVTLIIYVVVAIIQFRVPDFLTSLVTRELTTTDLSSSGRGMMSLTGEPSHFGKTITILNILLVFKNLVEGQKSFNYKSLQLISILLFIMNCLLSQSFYACFFHFICLFGISYILNPRTTLIFGGLVFFGLASAISVLALAFPEARIAQIANLLFTRPELLFQQGAMVRALNIPLTFVNLYYFGIWGTGNSSLVFAGQIDLGLGVLQYSVWNRLYGGFIEYVLKMGVLSVPLVIGYLYMIITMARIRFRVSGHLRSIGFIFAGMLFMLSVQDGSLGSPLMIFVVIYIFLKAQDILKQSRSSNSSFNPID